MLKYLYLVPFLTASILLTVWSWHDSSRFAEDDLVYGLSSKEIQFYEAFEGPLLDLSAEEYSQLSYEEQKQIVRTTLEADYAEKQPLIVAHFHDLTAEQQWLAYLTLRVNGSIPIYAQHSPARDLTEIVYKKSASCNGYALRLSFVLRAFDYDPKIYGFVTPSIPGHVVVALRDNEGDAVLLDANTNAVIVYPDTTDDFFQIITNTDQNTIAEKLKVYTFPYYERAFQPLGSAQVDNTVESVVQRNQIYTAAVQTGWLSTFTTEQQTLIATLVPHTDVDLANDRAIAHYAQFWNL